MSKKLIPFDLEAFRNGQKAIFKGGNTWFEYRFTSSCGKLAYEFNGGSIGHAHIDLLTSNAGMVSRHQHLIDSYRGGDAWQFRLSADWQNCTGTTGNWVEPTWNEDYEFRPHPYSELIIAYRTGVPIQFSVNNDDWMDAESPNWDNDCFYRIKPQPKTKIVYEWMYEDTADLWGDESDPPKKFWFVQDSLMTEEDFKIFADTHNIANYKKTGRQYEVKDE